MFWLISKTDRPHPGSALRRLFYVPATLLLMLAGLATGWVATSPASSEPAVAPRPSAVIELKPPIQKPQRIIPAAIRPGDTSTSAETQLLAESRCLAEVMYFEARGEGEAGQIAVAQVILRRLAGGGHGSTICGVVYEGVNQTFCQFTFACTGALAQSKTPEPWRAAQVLAAQLLAGQLQPGNATDGATNFHSASTRARWDSKMVRVAQIGNHVFYRPASLRPSIPGVAFRGSLQ